MKVEEAIQNRRSVRRYKPDAIPREQIVQVIQAGMLAPSAKNRQPWKFVVVQGGARGGLFQAMEEGIQREDSGNSQLPGSQKYVSSALYTLKIMQEAPVTILLFRPGQTLPQNPTQEQWFYDAADMQSIGAALQNMCLAATGLGLGTLWICDVFFAYDEIMRWSGENGQLAAALSLGVPNEAPKARPRKPMEETVRWL